MLKTTEETDVKFPKYQVKDLIIGNLESNVGIVGIQNIRSYFLFRTITKMFGSDVFIKIFSRKSDPP